MRQLILKSVIIALFFMIIPVTPTSASTSSDIDTVLAEAEKHLGVPYLFGGTTPDGFDCSGFLAYIFNKIGMTLPRTAATQYNTGEHVAREALVPGDLVFFEGTYNKAGITHSGLYIGNNQFISATTSQGVKIDSLASVYWGAHYAGAKRIFADGLPPLRFTDVPKNHEAYNAIKVLTDKKIINGTSATTFAPENFLTRGQAAVIVNRILEKEPKNIQSFSDVPVNSWYAKDIAAVKEAGIIEGHSDGTFRPDVHVTRAAMAAIVQRTFELQNNAFIPAGGMYTDVPLSHWAYDEIMTMRAIDTTNVFQTDMFQVSSEATRAVYVVALYNAMQVKK